MELEHLLFLFGAVFWLSGWFLKQPYPETLPFIHPLVCIEQATATTQACSDMVNTMF